MAIIKSPMALKKQELRQHFKGKWELVIEKTKKAEMLTEHLVSFLQKKTDGQPSFWCGYQALDSEISIQEVTRRCSYLHWVYPRVEGSRLRFFVPGAQGFSQGSFGLREPVIDLAKEVLSKDISGFLIPGLAFAKNGIRLGWGQGFYDRALAQTSAVKVGVSFSGCVVEELPLESWDIPMDFLVTEEDVKEVRTKKG